ncbi:HlyD family efflux transporter periplasmic adaptor subunit [Comamonas sp. GB3 AK4-5]|uniref:HlyD family efflux transporter periplasmic adaptor subunit n=1 Tax=Comamonas sp. GB3 AK4-5 TaxID=3231487 RepID=UPI00351E59A2
MIGQPQAWQPLREELDLLAGPVLADGQPSWTLHDPVRNLFFQLDWASFEVLRRWHMADAQAIARDVGGHTTLHVSAADVEVLQQFLQGNELLQPPLHGASALDAQWQRRRAGWSQWLLHNYLFFRVPLLRPDRWLTRWAPRLDFLFRPGFWWLTLAALLWGLWGVARSWEVFRATLVDMWSLQGLLAYGVTLLGVKCLHEVGHGITAKRYGCKVPAMGVAFLVLWPVAYTDTNEVWKLTRRDQRLKVAAAGITTELLIAVWALLAWLWLPEGWPKSSAFLLATTTWVSTVLINASPFMRFDGYFLLSDYLQLPNLHSRAFALARWDLRERLFALGEAPPEHFGPTRQRLLIVFAWVTWIYRLVLFLGIAALVYHFFIKAVGILLFGVEILWFIAKPLWSELKAWHERGAQIARSRRARRSALVLLGLLALLVVPWPVPVHSSGMLQATAQWQLHAPEAAQLVQKPLDEGSLVTADTHLFALASPVLQAAALSNQARLQQVVQQSAAAGMDGELRRDWQVWQDRQAEALAQQAALDADAARYQVQAGGSGMLRDVDPDLQAGAWLARRELLGRVVDTQRLEVVAYVEEQALHRIRPGDSGLFITEGSGSKTLALRVRSIDQDASRSLNEGALAAPAGGNVPVRSQQEILYPEQPVYRVVLDVVPGEALPAWAGQHRWRGRVSIRGAWEAPSAQFVRSAASVFWREAGF